MLLDIKNISFGFTGNKQLLDNISFSLEQGSIYTLMGTNGSGKTTLFNLISGFLKPQSGEILFRGQNILHFPAYKINRLGIGRTFQDLRLVTKLSVKENILLAMQNNPSDNWIKALMPSSVYKKELTALSDQADKIIKEYFLHDVKNSLAGEISFGQQKLLTLACCAANNSQCLLLDEPVSGIQPEYQHKIAEKLKQLKQQGKTIFFIDHNTGFIADLADRIFFLHEGSLSLFNNITALRADKSVVEAYL